MNDPKTALFTNFSSETFIGGYNGKTKAFAPGQSLYMPARLARHFAKHLTNRELLRVKPDGTLVYKDGEKMTSPKKPQDVPIFMELFNKAYTPDTEPEDDMLGETDSIDTQIAVANKNREKRAAEQNAKANGEAPATPKAGAQDPNEPQIILPPEDDGNDEDSFEGKPVETPSSSNQPAIGL